MKSKKVSLFFLAVIMTASLLTACGSKTNAAVGTWKATTVEASGVSVSLADYEASTGTTLEITFDFKSDGTVTGNMNGETVDGTYTVDGSNVSITFDGETETLTIDGNQMTLESEGTKIILAKS